MNDVLKQVIELARTLNALDIEPVICGGLGVYLSFFQNENNEPGILRATKDIDLMLTRREIIEQTKRRAIHAVLTEKLGYERRSDIEGCFFRFAKEQSDIPQELDILCPPIEGVNGVQIAGNRVKLVRHQMHGRLTPEACFIEEDTKQITLSDESAGEVKMRVPSPTNLLIFKLHAFRDRIERNNPERVQAHTWDIYAIITLVDRSDFEQGQKFLTAHVESDIIRTAQVIIRNHFSSIYDRGWYALLQTSDFFPARSIQDRRLIVTNARKRLLRWFGIVEPME
jgi:hypothetical protein